MGTLIITVPSNKEESAKIEILDCIFPRDYEAKFIEHKYHGILILESKKLSSDEMLQLLEECPTAYVYKIIPVDAIVESNLNSIMKKVEELARNRRGRAKVDCKRRGTTIKSSYEVEVAIGRFLKEIGYTIDLKNPDFIIAINVIDEWTAISFGPPKRFVDKRVRK